MVYVVFGLNTLSGVDWCPEIEISSVDWAQPSRLLPEDQDRIQSPKRF
jgi:hypothetical protein